MKSPIAFVCNMCGSNQVLMDAWARWDVETQDWVLDDTLVDAFCEDCDGETRLVEVELAAGTILPNPAARSKSAPSAGSRCARPPSARSPRRRLAFR